MKKISTKQYKGARDIYPDEMLLRNYIFNVWRSICTSYGYEEYDFPILEPFEIYAAKTGEEIVNEQMFSFTDQGDRKIAVRPELTPGTVRMISKKYNELPKPLKWFMIGSNWRYERPQKGRGREFIQLEVNQFGVTDVLADVEIFSIMIDVLSAFGATDEMYKLKYSDRRIISALLENELQLDSDTQLSARRLMDRREKMSQEEFIGSLSEIGIDGDQAKKVNTFMDSDFDSISSVISKEVLKSNQGYKNLLELRELLSAQGLDRYCEFDPSIIRGFDYSDGLVYEVFDKNPDFNRSLFGGERFDKLIEIFQKDSMAATGFAMGDIPLIEFLKGWDLIPEFKESSDVMVSVFDEEGKSSSLEVAQAFREVGLRVVLYPEAAKLAKQFSYADKKSIPWVIIVGEEEKKEKKVSLKNMTTGDQELLDPQKAYERIVLASGHSHGGCYGGNGGEGCACNH